MILENKLKKAIVDREKSLHIFIDRVKEIALEFKDQGVMLLVENNVLSKNNFINFGCNPFLLIDVEECNYFMSKMPENVRLLIDVAHLKVSANSLNFNPEEMLKECARWTYAYHLSDNDGFVDSNSPISSDSWFWPHLNNNVKFYVLEVYNISESELQSQVKLVSKMLNKNTI